MASMINRDVRDIGRVAFFSSIAWLTTPRLWRIAAQLTRSIGSSQHYLPAIKRIFAGEYSDAEIANVAARLRCNMRELNLQILGLHGPWRSWRPDIRLTGITHLRKALEAGHGAILW